MRWYLLHKCKYSSSYKWCARVKKMSCNQVLAIYKRFEEEKMIT